MPRREAVSIAMMKYIKNLDQPNSKETKQTPRWNIGWAVEKWVAVRNDDQTRLNLCRCCSTTTNIRMKLKPVMTLAWITWTWMQCLGWSRGTNALTQGTELTQLVCRPNASPKPAQHVRHHRQEESKLGNKIRGERNTSFRLGLTRWVSPKTWKGRCF